MGLTIHFQLRLPSTWSLDQVLAAMAKLWQAAKSLPFQSQSNMITLSEHHIERAIAGHNESPWRWACIQHTRYHCYRYDTMGRPYSVSKDADGTGTHTMSVPATTLVGFTCVPGNGCEVVNVFVGKYPNSIMVDCKGDQHGYPSGKRRLMMEDPFCWTASAFCKTQYASQPCEGGVTNFLRCHLLVIALLDTARELGFTVEVDDEGQYDERRSIPDLIREVGSWNTMIAGVGASLRAEFGNDVQTATSTEELAEPVDRQIATALGDDVLDLIRRTKGTTVAMEANHGR